MRWVVAALLMFGFVMMMVALNAGWASSSDDDETQWRMMSARANFGSESNPTYGYFPWSGAAFDDQDGMGGIRAGGPLWITGVVLVGLAMAAWGYAQVGPGWMQWALAGVIGTATLLALLALILYPVGVTWNHDWDVDNGSTSPDATITWLAGLYLGVVAVASLVAATVLQVRVAR